MSLNLNKEKALAILKAYYDITHLSVKLFDIDCNQIAMYPENQTAEYCKMLRSHDEIFLKCQQCYHRYFEYIRQRRIEQVSYCCHANVLNILVPISKGQKLYGYLYLRHARSDEVNNSDFLNKISKQYDLDFKKLSAAFKKLPIYNEEKFKSTINILEVCLYYFIANQIIEYEEDPLMEQVRSYIKENIGGDLSISTLCKKFYINKNNLYSLFARYENTTVSKFIIDQKIEVAKSLLHSSNDSIQEICEKIGIQNYNYFIIFFRKNTGVSPLKYRKASRSK